MVKADLIARTMGAAALEGPVARKAVEALFEGLCEVIQRGDRVALRRFGVFHTRPRRTGKARDPRTGEPAGIPLGRTVRFRPVPSLLRITSSQ